MTQLVGTSAAYSGYTVQDYEDLLDFMTLASPFETPTLSMLARVPATNILHEWLEDTLNTASSGGAIDGDVRAAPTQGPPSRRGNYCQIVRRDYAVSGSQEASKAVGGSWSGWQIVKALKEIALDAEVSLIQGIKQGTPQGDATTARRMDGLTSFLGGTGGGTHLIVGGTAGQITETQFNNLLKQIWTGGGMADTVICSPDLKDFVSNLTTVERMHHAQGVSDPRMIVKNVQVYESAYGTVELHLSRYVTKTNELWGYAFERRHLRTAWLRPPMVKELGTRGDNNEYMVLAELTLEVLHSKAGGIWVRT